MRFTLSIEFDNEQMRTRTDLRDAIRDVATSVGAALPCGVIRSLAGGAVMDVNGNSVGQWAVEKDESSPAEQLARVWEDTITQHNLLSTATDDQRRAFILRNLAAYNTHAVPILKAMDARNGTGGTL